MLTSAACSAMGGLQRNNIAERLACETNVDVNKGELQQKVVCARKQAVPMICRRHLSIA